MIGHQRRNNKKWRMPSSEGNNDVAGEGEEDAVNSLESGNGDGLRSGLSARRLPDKPPSVWQWRTEVRRECMTEVGEDA